jgi:isopentenyl-diphosphate delta-isomerase
MATKRNSLSDNTAADLPASRAPRSTESRKADHVRLAATGEVGHRTKLTGFDSVEFEHDALPELALPEIDLRANFLGHALSAPLIISSMTGGYADALEINRALGECAEQFGLAIGVGSQRQALESTEYHASFRVVREMAPNAFVIANIGGVELAKLHASGDSDSIRKLIDLIEANALAIHVNPLQELMQPEGARDFRGIAKAIEWIVRTVELPVIVKEVGAGISSNVARRLLGAGVRAIDVAGAGGTSWAGIELMRREGSTDDLDCFWDWGIPTAQCIREVAELKNERVFELIASGGVQTGIDVAKSIALGADLAGMARPFIQAYMQRGREGLAAKIEGVLDQLRITMLLTGSRTLGELRNAKLLHH